MFVLQEKKIYPSDVKERDDVHSGTNRKVQRDICTFANAMLNYLVRVSSLKPLCSSYFAAYAI